MKYTPEWIRQTIKDKGKLGFYSSYCWKKKRLEVLRVYHFECLSCKTKGKYKKAEHVHHVLPLLKHPHLGLKEKYLDHNGNEQIQLMPLCAICHEQMEGRSLHNKIKNESVLFPERW